MLFRSDFNRRFDASKDVGERLPPPPHRAFRRWHALPQEPLNLVSLAVQLLCVDLRDGCAFVPESRLSVIRPKMLSGLLSSGMAQLVGAPDWDARFTARSMDSPSAGIVCVWLIWI